MSPQTPEALERLAEQARAATTTLRNLSMHGTTDYRTRDPLVVAIHNALDALLAEVSRLRAAPQTPDAPEVAQKSQ